MPEPSAPACRLKLPVREIDLGTVPQRGTAKKQLEVYNPGPGRVEVVSISTSCPCLHVRLTEQVLEPDQKAWCLLELDMAKEPDFTGHLRMQVEGQTAQGELALRLTVLVRVNREEK